MDHYGIGAAMQGVARVYLQSARQSGRTTSMVASLKDGDRVVFMDREEAERVRRMCLDRGATVECIVVDVQTPGRVLESRPSKGRTLFDHSWVEQFYLSTIERAQQDLDHLESEASGSREAHKEPWRETRWEA